MHIHILLAFTPYGDPAIQYDLSLPLSTLEKQISPEEFSEAATHPPVSSLRITCPHFQWPIVVSPSSRSVSFVTVLDVFDAVYRALRVPVHPTEYKQLPSSDATRNVNAAYYHRCERVGDLDERKLEESKGVKRVDFLVGKNQFLGLSGTHEGPDIWELNVC
jgi:hypothetical protein